MKRLHHSSNAPHAAHASHAAERPAAERPAAERLVSDALQLLPAFRHAELAPAGRRAAAAQAAAVVRAADPLLAQLLDVRVVTTRRGADQQSLTNHVNLRVAAPFATMLHHERARVPHGSAGAPELLFCFLASEQLEPIVVVVAVHPELGRLERLEPAHVPALETAVQQFKTRFGLKDETYAYTCLKDRLAAASCHSRHFHLKIRIPTEMYLRVFPAAQVLGNNHACLRRALEPFKQRWEPLAFRFQTQELFPWSIVRLLVLSDVDDGEYKP
jgi:hypothetical protein